MGALNLQTTSDSSRTFLSVSVEQRWVKLYVATMVYLGIAASIPGFKGLLNHPHQLHGPLKINALGSQFLYRYNTDDKI